MNIVTLAKVLGTSYAVAKEIDTVLKKFRQAEHKRSGYRKVRKGKKY